MDNLWIYVDNLILICYFNSERGQGYMDFIVDFLTGVFLIGTSVLDGLGALFTAAIGIMYGGTPAVITPIGYVVIAVVAVPLAIGVFNWLLGQLKKLKPAPGGKK